MHWDISDLKQPNFEHSFIYQLLHPFSNRHSRMKAKIKKEVKTFDAVKSMREIKDKISMEIQDMNFEQLKAYFEQKRLQRTKE